MSILIYLILKIGFGIIFWVQQSNGNWYIYDVDWMSWPNSGYLDFDWNDEEAKDNLASLYEDGPPSFYVERFKLK